MMQLRIRHETLYRYDEPVSYSIQSLKLTPRPDPGQRVLSWRIQSPGERMEQIDPYGNVTHLVTVEVPHREMRIVVEGVAEIGPTQSEGMPEESQLSPLAYLAPTSLTRADAAIRRLAERCFGLHPAAPETLADLMREVCTAVRYQPGTTDVHHSAAEAIDFGEGVCQDQAHVFIAACRRLGVPARYVSGYLRNDDPELHVGRTSHSWAEAWMPGLEWVGFDPANDISPRGDSLRVAVGLDYRDAAPVSGRRVGFGDAKMSVEAAIKLIDP
jgi:transglutaminase-like putative cysteine protease